MPQQQQVLHQVLQVVLNLNRWTLQKKLLIILKEDIGIIGNVKITHGIQCIKNQEKLCLV